MNKKIKFVIVLLALITAIFVNIHAQAKSYYNASIEYFAGFNDMYLSHSFDNLNDAINWEETNYYSIVANENSEITIDWQYDFNQQYFNSSWSNGHYAIGTIIYPISNTQSKSK